MVEIILYILAGILLGLALPVLFMRSRNSRNDVSVRLDAMDKLYREMLKKRQSSDFRYSEEVRKVIDRVHAEKMLK